MLIAITRWKNLRSSLLTVTLGAVFLVAGKSIFYPPTSNLSSTSFEFPQSVPLPEWQAIDSTPLVISEDSDSKSGRIYRYQQNSLPLEIKMGYVVDTIGNVENLIRAHNVFESSPGKLTIVSNQEVGFHGLLQHQNRAYLSACINPRGGSTVTSEQFKYNRNTYDLQLSRIVSMLLGQVSRLQDRRCLWTQISIPLDKTTPTDANKILETTWVSWYQWWQPRFPPP
ncbi:MULTISPECIES: cyanoexosortase A system-associated protein [Kamptonema]|uniref:cyanoexosortase A system-associated protein n=1 Tax=Kamptonema TaxID=1501433 RepID=UPI00031875CE|nr:MULTISPECIES: cyanoexosortase A system-associated protein [Kamptonema]